MLIAESLACARGGRVVLTGLTFRLAPGEMLGILGANGAGKSSLLATLSGELPPAGGRLLLDGHPMSAWTPAGLATRRAALPQTPSLGFDMPVHELLEIGAYPFPDQPPAAVAELVQAAAGLAGIGPLLDRAYATLSGGEQQRVQFARVLVQLLAGDPDAMSRLLLLDEPTASLDPQHQIGLLGAVRRLCHQRPIAAAVVLHDVNLAASFCDRLLLLADGGVAALGLPAEVLTPALLARVFGLPARVLRLPERQGRPLVLFCEDAPG